MSETVLKECNTCHDLKPNSEFRTRKNRSTSGYHTLSKCKKCDYAVTRIKRDIRLNEKYSSATQDHSDIGPSTQILDAGGHDWSWAFVVFREIPGADGCMVGSDGSVWSRRIPGRTQKLGDRWNKFKPTIAKKTGYEVIAIRFNEKSKPKSIYVHRLVLMAFVGNCPMGFQACHFPDRTRTNNKRSNLRWDTVKANSHDRVFHGTDCKGEKSYKAIATESLVLEIRQRHKNGETIKKICANLNLKRPTVSSMVNRYSWKHVQ